MSRRIFTLATLPVLFLLALSTAGCSDAAGPSAAPASFRHGADDPPGDNRGVDLPGDDKGVDATVQFKRGADDPAGDDRGGHGADDPVNHR